MLTEKPPAFRPSGLGADTRSAPGDGGAAIEGNMPKRASLVYAGRIIAAPVQRASIAASWWSKLVAALLMVWLLSLIVYVRLTGNLGPTPFARPLSENHGSTVAGFAGGLVRVRSIELAESPSVINVSPRVKPDPRGGFLIADADESQIRRYSPGGELLGVFGRKGRGPGEFERLSAVVRTHAEQLLAVEMGGRLSLFDSAGASVLRTWNTPLAPIYGAAGHRDTLVVLSARRGGQMAGELIHVFDSRTGTILRSMFPMPTPAPRMTATYAFAGTADAAVRGDTIAAVFALSDSIYLFSVDGRRLRTIPIPFRHFRPVTEPVPLRGTISEYRRWGSRFSAISRVYWTDRGFLIQYYNTDGAQPQWNLLGMTHEGRWLFENTQSPELLTTSEADSLLYFVDPNSLTPNRWLVARMNP